ncbi:MAG: sugar phosphate isomerase/epimerase [Phycisphaerae bacterium]|nr:sugar phosphate isomerase/epimerase [Phycisphaerae bacterium]
MKDTPGSQHIAGQWTRRHILGTAAAGAAAWALPAQAFGAAKPKEIPIGVQLYSMRGDCDKDIDAVLQRVAKMGFAGVEFYGNSYFKYNKKAKELRKRLDDLNLKSEGIHAATSALRGDELKNTIEVGKILGSRFIIVPGDSDITHPEKSKALAEVFNKAAEVLKPHGLFCGFHNHTSEFKKEGNKTYWDLFAERTSKDVVLQQDVGHTAAAGVDPVALFRKYPGRSGSTHFAPHADRKQAGKKAIIGQDSIDWKACITACREVGATEWFVIEQESYPEGKSPMECTEMSLAGLKKILADMTK